MLIHMVFVHRVMMAVMHVVDMVTMLHAFVPAFFTVNVSVSGVLFARGTVMFALSTAVVIFVVFAFCRALVILLAVRRAFVIFAVGAISAALVSGSISRCSGNFIGLAGAGSENK